MPLFGKPPAYAAYLATSRMAAARRARPALPERYTRERVAVCSCQAAGLAAQAILVREAHRGHADRRAHRYVPRQQHVGLHRTIRSRYVLPRCARRPARAPSAAQVHQRQGGRLLLVLAGRRYPDRHSRRAS
eukprot:IDg12018t1